jgi:hypothetical protein
LISWWVHTKCNRRAIIELGKLGMRCLYCGVSIINWNEVIPNVSEKFIRGKHDRSNITK